MSSNEPNMANTKVSSLLAEGPPREDDTYRVIGAVHLKLLSMQPFVVGLINSQEEENARSGGGNNGGETVGIEGSKTKRSGGGLGWPENAAGTAGNVADDHRAHAALPLPSFVSAGVDACLERLSLTNNVLEAAWLRALRKAEEMAETSPNKHRNSKAAGKKQGNKATNTNKASTAAALSGSTSSFSPRGGRSSLHGSSHNLSTTFGDSVSAAVASVMLHQQLQQEGSPKGSCSPLAAPLSATVKNPLTAPDGPHRSPFVLSELEYIAQNTERFVDCARAHNTLMLVSVVGPDASATARHIRHAGKFSDIGALTEARTLSEYWAVRFPLSTDSTFAEVLLSLKSAGPTIIDHTAEAKRRAQSLLDENHGGEDEDSIRSGGRPPAAAAAGLHARLHAQMQHQQQMHHSRRADDETWAMMATEEMDEISGFTHQTTRLISALFHCKDTQCFAQWREPVVMYPSTVANIDLAGGEARRPEHSIVVGTNKFNDKPRQHGRNEDEKKEGMPSSDERTHSFPIAPAPVYRQYCGFSGSLAPTDIAYPTRGRLLPTSLHSKLLERLRARVPHTALERSQLFGPVVGGLRRETGLLLPTSSPQLYALERTLFHGEVKTIADGHKVTPHTSQSNNNPMSAAIPIYRVGGTPPIAHLPFSGGSFAGGGGSATASFAVAHPPTDSFRPMSPLRLASSVGHPQSLARNASTATPPPATATTAVGETLITRESTLPPLARDGEQQQNLCPPLPPLPIDELWISHQSDVAHDLWSVGVISLEWMLRLAFSKPTLGTDLKDAILVFLGGNTTFATLMTKKSRLGGRAGGADTSLPNSGNTLFNAHQSGGVPENAPFEVPFTIAHTAAHQRLQYAALKLTVSTINRCAEGGGGASSGGDALNTSLSGASGTNNSNNTSFVEGIGSSPRRRRGLSGWAGALPMPSIAGGRAHPHGAANLTPPPSQHQSANVRRAGSFSKGAKGDASPFSSALHVGESRGMPPTPSSYANLHLYAGRTWSNNNSFAGEPEDTSSSAAPSSSSSVVNLRDPHTLAQHILRVLDILAGDTLSKGAIESVFTSLLLWRSEDRWKWFESSVVTHPPAHVHSMLPEAFSAEQERPTSSTTEAEALQSYVAVTKASAEKPISPTSPIAALLSSSPSPLGSHGNFSPASRCCVPFVCDELSVRPSALEAVTAVTAAATAASLDPITVAPGTATLTRSARSDTVYMDSIRSIRNSATRAFPPYRLDLKALLTTFKTQVERTASAEHGHLHLRDVRQYHMFIEYLKLTSASAESIATVEATLHSAAVKEASIMLARATRAMIKERERALSLHLATVGGLADSSSPLQPQGANNDMQRGGQTETKKKSGSFIKSFFSFTSKSSSSKKKEEDEKRSYAENKFNNGNATLIPSFNSSSMHSNRYSDPVDSLFSTPNTSFSGLPRDTGNNGGLLLTSPRSDGSLSPLMLLNSPDRNASPQASALRIAEESHNATIALLHSLAVGGGAVGSFGKNTRSGGGGLRSPATGGSSSYDGGKGGIGASFRASESSASTAAERAKAFAQAAFGDSSLVSIANILNQSSETARACAALHALAFLRERDLTTNTQHKGSRPPRTSYAGVANQGEDSDDSSDDGGAFHHHYTQQSVLGFGAQNTNVSFSSPFTSFAGGNHPQQQALGGVWRINSPLHGPSYSAAFLAPNIYADYSAAAAANGIPFLLNGVGSGVGASSTPWPVIATAAQNNPFANPMHFQPADYARDTLIIRARDVAEALPVAMKAWRKKQAGTGVSVHTSLLECFGVPQANVAASTSTVAPMGACGGGGSGGQRRGNRGGVGGAGSGSAANGGFLLPGYAGSTRAEDKKKPQSNGLTVDDGLNNDASINNDQKKKKGTAATNGSTLSSVSSSSDMTDVTSSSTRSSASFTSPTRNGDDEHSIQVSRRRQGSQYRLSTKEDEHDEDEDDERNPMKSPAIAALESRRGRRLLTVLREETPFPPALLATLREFIMNPFVDEEGFRLALAHVRGALAETIKAEEKKDLAANIRHSVWNRHVPIVPPALRALCWAKLLSLPLHDRHRRIDAPFHSVNTYHTMGSDRQIAVDVPRCHQYHHLLASVEGHRKLHHVCKAWLALHPAYVYWQGVDSIAAVVLTAAFNDPPLAAATLGAIVDRYVPHYYNKERTMDQQLHTYTHVLTYADPDLALHLEALEVKPELYTISWFLTLFAHILPCEKVYLIWDRLFRSRSMGYTVCVAAALMSQMREGIMGSDFSGCVSLLSNSALQGVVDVARAAADADALLYSIPSTVLSPRYDVAMGALVRTSVCAMIEASELAEAYGSRADRSSNSTATGLGNSNCWWGEGKYGDRNDDDEEHENEEANSGLHGLSDDVTMLSAECGMKKSVARCLITRLSQVKAISSRNSVVRLGEKGAAEDSEDEERGNDNDEDDLDALFSDFVTVKYNTQKTEKRTNSNSNAPHRLIDGPHWADAGVFIIDVRTDDEIRGHVGGVATFDHQQRLSPSTSVENVSSADDRSTTAGTRNRSNSATLSQATTTTTAAAGAGFAAVANEAGTTTAPRRHSNQNVGTALTNTAIVSAIHHPYDGIDGWDVDAVIRSLCDRRNLWLPPVERGSQSVDGVAASNPDGTFPRTSSPETEAFVRQQTEASPLQTFLASAPHVVIVAGKDPEAGQSAAQSLITNGTACVSMLLGGIRELKRVAPHLVVRME